MKTLNEHMLEAERDYWRAQLATDQPMREIAKTAGLSYRQMYYHMGKVGVRAARKARNRLSSLRGRLLSSDQSTSFSMLSERDRAAAIEMVVNDMRAKQSRQIARMRRTSILHEQRA